MGFLMESGEVGNIGLKQLREQREITTNRWEKIGLLEGLEGNVKENCAQLFENQLSYMINESTDTASSESALLHALNSLENTHIFPGSHR